MLATPFFNRVIRFLLPALLLAAPLLHGQGIGAHPQESPAGIRILRDLPYIPGGGPHQQLDLYLPARPASSPMPLVAYIHGGAWKAGSKAQCPARRLTSLGYIVASVEYRFSQDAPFPAQIEDCKAAIRWLRANAGQYGIDPNRIGVMGASAGGHLVALLGVTGQSKEFDEGPNSGQSSAVQCVVDFFGPTDFLHYGDHPETEFDSPSNAVAELLGGPISTHQALARAASPIYDVNRGDPPFLILQGDQDPLVPEQQSQELNAALQKDGVESTLDIIPGAGHGGPLFNTAKVWTIVTDFLNRHLHPG